MDNLDDYFTWCNKHIIGTIYSRIDRVLGNNEWYQSNLDTILNNLPPNVSDHALLCVSKRIKEKMTQKHLKFTNCLVDMESYDKVIKNSWMAPIKGSPMYVLWHKQKRLKTVLKQFSKPLSTLKKDILKAIEELQKAQHDSAVNRMDPQQIQKIKQLTEKVIQHNQIKERILMQRDKVDWLRKGDDNNSFFFATIKTK